MADGDRSTEDKAQKGPLSVGEAADSLFDILPDDDPDNREENRPGRGENPADPDSEELEEEFEDDELEHESEEFDSEEGEEFEDDEDFEDEEFEDEDDSRDFDSEDLQDSRFTVKVAGEEMEVTLDELKKGYSRTQDYTRKTTEVAEERKALTADRQRLTQERSEVEQKLAVLEEVLEDQLPAEPDWNKLRKELDPAEYAARYADWQRQSADLKVVREERQANQQELTKEQRKQLENIVRAEQARLIEQVPELKDPEIYQKEMSDLSSWLQTEMGFPPEALASIVDHRLILLARNAKRFTELKDKGRKKGGKKGSTKTLKPSGRSSTSSKGRKGRRKSKKTENALRRLKKSGRVEDAARTLETLLPED